LTISSATATLNSNLAKTSKFSHPFHAHFSYLILARVLLRKTINQVLPESIFSSKIIFHPLNKAIQAINGDLLN
jgi:hypothetical protein